MYFEENFDLPRLLFEEAVETGSFFETAKCFLQDCYSTVQDTLKKK